MGKDERSFSVTNSNLGVLWRSPWLLCDASWLAVLWRSPWLCCVMLYGWLYCEGHIGCAVRCLIAGCTVKVTLAVLCDASLLYCEGHPGCAVWCFMVGCTVKVTLAVLFDASWLAVLWMVTRAVLCDASWLAVLWRLSWGCYVIPHGSVKATMAVLCDAPWLCEGHPGCAVWCPLAMWRPPCLWCLMAILWRPPWLCRMMPHGSAFGVHHGCH